MINLFVITVLISLGFYLSYTVALFIQKRGEHERRVKDAKWLVVESGVACSVCGTVVERLSDLPLTPIYQYCPYCGVEMQGESL